MPGKPGSLPVQVRPGQAYTPGPGLYGLLIPLQVNRQFAIHTASQAADAGLVWIHDYYLILLPAMLSEEVTRRSKRFAIGFFLHTPFPSCDMFKVVPVWRDHLESAMHGYLIGFHTSTYVENFNRTCHDLL
jgi:trehalose 6-phosphate synthase